MSEWIDIKEKLPDTDCDVLVGNVKGFMRNIKATYHKKYNVFILYDPDFRKSICLDVTHWLPLPSFPSTVD